jgi:hypothetical protein
VANFLDSVLNAFSLIFRARFFNPKTGELYKLGEKILYPRLAKTLQIIADEGINAFYNGSLAKDIVADIKDAGKQFIDVRTGLCKFNRLNHIVGLLLTRNRR